MEKHEVMKILVLIESVYPDFRIKSDSVENWFAACRGLDFHQVMKNLSSHIRRSPYPPLMAEIALFSIKDFAGPGKGNPPGEEGWIQTKQDNIIPRLLKPSPWQDEYMVM